MPLVMSLSESDLGSPQSSPPSLVEEECTPQALRQPSTSSPALALQTLADGVVRAVRNSGLLPTTADTKLPDMRSAMNALVPLLSMPLWLPFSFMLSVFSYFMTVLLQAMDAPDNTSSPVLAWISPQQRGQVSKLRRISSTSSLSPSLSSSSSILRALDQVLDLVTALPPSSPKYNFTRSLAERLLADNTTQKPPLLDLNCLALSRSFLYTVEQLEACLARDAGATRSWGAIVRRCSQAAGWAQSLTSPQDSSTVGPTYSTLRAEKLSQELLWLAEMLFEYEGGPEALRLWASVPRLAGAARRASPRVQGNLVKLSALLVRAASGSESSGGVPSAHRTYQDRMRPARPLSYSGGSEFGMGFGGSAAFSRGSSGARTACPLDLQHRLLLLWLPLMCRAAHTGDGPILSSSEKQRTEEALQQIILRLGHSEQEALFSSWLYEYSWSSSDWPNLQPQYVSWCERARSFSSMSEGFHVVD